MATLFDAQMQQEALDRKYAKDLGTGWGALTQLNATSGANLGRGIMGLFGGKSPMEQKVLQQQAIMKNFDPSNLQSMYDTARDLMQKGYNEQGMKILEQANELRKTAMSQKGSSGANLSSWGKTMRDISSVYGLDLSTAEGRKKAGEVAEAYKRADPKEKASIQKELAKFKQGLAVDLALINSNLGISEKIAGMETEGVGKLSDQVYSDGITAESDIGRYDNMLTLLDEIDTGATTNWQVEGKNIAKSIFGVDVNIAGEESFRNMAMMEVLGFVAQTKGAISNREMELFEQASPGLGKTPEGNRLIIAFAKSAAERKKALSSEFAKWRKGLGGKRPTRQDWELHKEKWKEKQKPFLTQEKIDDLLGKNKENRTVVRTGMKDGRKVVEYSDGVIDYAEE